MMRTLASHQYGSGGGGGGVMFDSRTRRRMWVEFVVGSRPCSERFLSGYSGFLLSAKTNISKFQFVLDYCQALYHEPLVREIAQALPVLLRLNKIFYLTLTTHKRIYIVLLEALSALCPYTHRQTHYKLFKFIRLIRFILL